MLVTLVKEKALFYYVCRGFWEVVSRYQQVEILAFALMTVAKQLQPYLKAHTIRVIIETPI